MIYTYLGEEHIEEIPGRPGSYRIAYGDWVYLGDTMTSALTVFKRYLALLLEYGKPSAKFRSVVWSCQNGRKVRIPGPYESQYKDFNRYLYDKIADPRFVKIIGHELSKEAKKFLFNYLSAGNFIAVPEHFNAQRSNYGEWDTADRPLWKVYQYFQNGHDDSYLYALFSYEQDTATAYCKQWFADAGITSWERFVSVNLLQPFVNRSMKPIALKTGKAVDDLTADDFLPNTLWECERFFKTANTAIEKRGQLILEKINEGVDA